MPGIRKNEVSMKLTFCPLFSGSSGNAIYVSAGDTRMLIDAGMPGKAIENALRTIDVLPETLTAIAVTHEHTDHTKGVGILSRKYHIPIYANERTFEAMAKTVGEIPKWDRRYFDTGEDFYVNDLALHPFAIPHDAADPVGYRLWGGNVSISTATDLGFFPRTIRDAVAGSSLVLLESTEVEKILDIQAVMIIGMEVIEKGVESPYQNPAAVYENRRRGIPVFDDREEEIRYLLQPEYKQFLQAGMQALNLS